MGTYYDTGVLVPLFIRESFSEALIAWVAAIENPIELHAFHRLELENALRLKVFRSEIRSEQQDAALDKIAAAIREDRLVIRPVDWIAALESARRLGAAATSRTGCRTLDLLHVAIAAQWRCETFVSADERQLRAAERAGLRIVDVRALPHRGRSGAVRERRERYAARARSADDKRKSKTGRGARRPAKEPA